MTPPSDPEWDRDLLAQVHPVDWVNPTPAGRYNLVVLGGGTAGLVSAAGAAGLGARVALVERHRLGGDCLNFGCVPSKALLRSARMAAEVHRAGRFGVRVDGEVSVDFPLVLQRMRQLRSELARNDSAQRFRSLGVDVFLGEGRFVGPDALEVDGQRLLFARAIIATGARPRLPEIPGLKDSDFLTNETIFDLAELPRRLAILGAGPIGCELGQAFRRFGSEVHLIDLAGRILSREEPEASDLLARTLTDEGVHLHLETRVRSGSRNGDRFRLVLESKTNDAPNLEVDAILAAVGRAPRLEGLGLEEAGVAHGPGGITVNEQLRTSNRRIFVAGDVASRHAFTHAADAMARLVLRNALFFGRGRVSDLVIPWCTFTEPEVARVGLTAGEAEREGVPIQTFRIDLKNLDRAVLDGETEGFAQIHVRKGTQQIVGATVMASRAGDMLGEVVLAMTRKIGLGTLSGVILPYPTLAEAIKRLGDSHEKTRLRPWMAAILRTWMRWRRR